MTTTKAHVRYRTKSGIMVPGTTTVLNLLAKPALVYWAWNLGMQGEDYRKVRDKAMERAMRPALESLGFEYQPKGIVGKPDFAHRGAMVAIFLDGCFFHGCPEHYREPEANATFWSAKVARNRERDIEVTARLESEGWRVIRAWEHDLKDLAENERKREKKEEKQSMD